MKMANTVLKKKCGQSLVLVLLAEAQGWGGAVRGVATRTGATSAASFPGFSRRR